MKKVFWRALFFLGPFLYSILASGQPQGKNDCSTTCFSSEIVSVETISETCQSYELKVSFSGDCSHALSHYSVGVPCGEITGLSNSGNWKQVIGTDPTTGLNGFKIDDIQEFGEGSSTFFTVRFTICAENETCADQLKCWQPVVAYKASTCVNYETLEVNCRSLKASLVHKDASCYGAADGSLSVVIEDGHEPFTFLWSDNSTEQSLVNAIAGDYSVIVRDASGAEVTLTQSIAQSQQLNIEGVPTPATCNGKTDGAIELSVSGGSAPYAFSWSNGSSAEDLQGLAAGQYEVTVTDNNNCTATRRFTIGNTSSVSLSVTLAAPDCNAGNGSIDLAVSGGAAPYSFAWSNGSTTEDLANLSAGLYSVTVTDDNGCSAQRSVFLKENNTLSLKALPTPTSCSGTPSGSLDLTVSGGTGPYSIVWSDGTTTEDIANLSDGLYTVRVEDSKGCTITASYTVSQRTFQVPRTITQPTCDGQQDGSIALLEPIGGTAPYTYQWSTGETGTTLTGLERGLYTVTITDATGCSQTLSMSIIAPTAIMASATVSSNACQDEGSQAIDLSVSGGTAPYTYQWSNGASTQDLDGLSGGTYTVVITDARGCSISKDIVVESGGAPLACGIQQLTTLPLCATSNNTLSASTTDADSYEWAVSSTDNSWTITAVNNASIQFSAGTANTSATFTLSITKDGCTKTCTYTVSACVPDDNGSGEPGGEQPGNGEPGDGEPGDGEPGDEDPGTGTPDNYEDCDTCFSTIASVIASSADCKTYEFTVNTSGLCARDLSHWTLALPCGHISDYSNSRGWQMTVGQDPTTGLYGLKVDNISDFGKANETFTVRFTICGSNCALSAWDPEVAYKAGQCVATEIITVNSAVLSASTFAVYPNPFTDLIHFEWQGTQDQLSLDIIDQYGNVVLRADAPAEKSNGPSLTLESSSLPKGMYYYRMIVDGRTHSGKLTKQ